MKTDTCQSCGANILWVETSNGKMMPFDARETKVLYREHVETMHVDTDQGIAEVEGYKNHVLDGYVNHFVTCPDSENWSGQSRE